MVIDAEVRQRALDPEHSFICEAPAGSGKTELLTQRLLTLLARVKTPEEVLAITFTRKAASEMRERVINALQKAKYKPEPDSPHEKMTWQLASQVLSIDETLQWHILDNPNRLRIQTFDSLCASLANTLPLHSSFASPPQVSEESHELYLQAAQRFIDSLEEEKPWSDAIAKVLRELDNNTQKLQRLLAGMLAQREAWLPLLGAGIQESTEGVIRTLESQLASVRIDHIQKLCERIPQTLCADIISLSSFAASNVQRLNIKSAVLDCLNLELTGRELPDASPEGIRAWLGIAAMLLTDKGSWRKTLNKNAGFPPGEGHYEKSKFQEKKQQALALITSLMENEGLAELLNDVRLLPTPSYENSQRILLEALLEILPILSAYLTISFQENNAVDFTEISLRASQALGDLNNTSELALVLDYKIQHILVDEFQDTSPSQIRLLTRLTAGWEIQDGRTLFCVGDAMQSIYGFRDANVGLFLDCLENGMEHISLEPLKLETNFRSQAGVVTWINEVFERAFPQRSDISEGAVAYSASTPHKEKAEHQAVSVHGFVNDTAYTNEAQKVLEIVETVRKENSEASIAILVRNRNHAAHITPLLTNAGFKYRAVDLEPLTEHVVIQDLMALTHALLRPADRIAWLSILRAPWCGLSLVDLEAIANYEASSVFDQLLAMVDIKNTDREHFHSQKTQDDLFLTSLVSDTETSFRLLTDDGYKRLSRIVPVLKAAIENRQRLSLRQWVEGTWLALGGVACLLDEQELTNAELFFNLLESLDVNGILQDRLALERAVQKLYSAPAPDSDENLQIMTIHKSKGLEFDCVIVPSLQKSPRRPDPELLRWYERLDADGEPQLLMAPITASGKNKDSVYAYLAELDKRRETHESCRLLYVACTRAKSQLHLLAQLNVDKKDETQLKAPPVTSLLHSIWSAIQLKINVYRNEEANEPLLTPVEKPKVLNRLKSDWQLPELPGGHLLDAYVPFYDHFNAGDNRFEWQDDTARKTGTLVHRILQALSESMIDEWDKNGMEAAKATWRNWLMSQGVASHHIDMHLERVLQAVSNVIDDKARRWLFSDAHPERRVEFPLSVSGKNECSDLVIDLLINDGDTTWIIDYKTSEPDVNESVDQFVARELAQYRPNMMKYFNAVKMRQYQNIKMALYFPMLGCWSEYTV